MLLSVPLPADALHFLIIRPSLPCQLVPAVFCSSGFCFYPFLSHSCVLPLDNLIFSHNCALDSQICSCSFTPFQSTEPPVRHTSNWMSHSYLSLNVSRPNPWSFAHLHLKSLSHSTLLSLLHIRITVRRILSHASMQSALFLGICYYCSH